MRRLSAAVLLCVSSVCAAQQPATSPKPNPLCLIKTSLGDVTVELFAMEAPKTVENFVGLAQGTREFTDPATKQKVKRPFYDGLIFHRVIKGFMIQGGCPTGNGKGGPGYRFEDEISADALGLHKAKALQPDGRAHPHLAVGSQRDFQRKVVMPLATKMGIRSQAQMQAREKEVRQRLSQLTVKDCYENLGYRYNDKLKSHAPKRGVLAMANSGPNTNGSQFFINLADTPWLTGKHTVFGRVVKGMEIVDKIGAVAVGQGHKPLKDVKVVSIRLLPQP